MASRTATATTLTLPDVDVAHWPASRLPALVAWFSAGLGQAAARLAETGAEPVPDDDEDELDVAGVAGFLNVPRSTAEKLMADRAFPVLRVGRYARVRKADLRAYRAARTEPARRLPAGIAPRYTRRHDKHRPTAAPPPAALDAAPARGRARRSHDDRLPLGDRAEPDPAARRHRLDVVRGARGDDEPLDVGAADALDS